jgi:N-acetylmuramoyl-L-alanine amidase
VEKELTLDVAKKVQKFLEKDGFEVHLTRNDDRHIPLGARLKAAQRAGSSLFVSVHANSAGQNREPSGIETYFSPGGIAGYPHSGSVDYVFGSRERSVNVLESASAFHRADLAKTCAKCLLEGVKSALETRGVDIKDRGVKTALFRILLQNVMPSVLVEVGFITNPHEAYLLVQDGYRAVLAYGIAKGIHKFFEETGQL